MFGIFNDPLKEMVSFAEGADALLKAGRNVWFSGCVDTQKVHLLAGVKDRAGDKWQLVVTYDEIRARELYEDFRFFEPEVGLLTAKDVIFFNADIASNYLTQKRMQVIRQIMENKGGIIVTTMDGLMNMLPPFDAILSAVIRLETGDELIPNEFSKKMVNMGYRREGLVEEPGTFCVRGGIVDIFPITEENPVRIELWGDQIDAIREFDVQSQRTIETLDEAVIYPASENYIPPENIESGVKKIRKELEKQLKVFRDNMRQEEAHRLEMTVSEFLEWMHTGAGMDGYIRYFYKKMYSVLEFLPADTIVALDEPERLIQKADAVEAEVCESMEQRLEKGYILPGQTELLFSRRQIVAMLQDYRLCAVSGMEYTTGFLKERPGKNSGTPLKLSVEAQGAGSFKNHFDMMVKELEKYRKKGWKVVIVTPSRTRGERQAASLREYGLTAVFSENAQDICPGEIKVVYGNLHKGFTYPLVRFAVLTENDLVGEKKPRKKPKGKYSGRTISDFSSLTVGDYVVHENYGVGIYKGIVNKKMDDEPKDYISILYGDGGTLYIPATQFYLIQKYAAADSDRKPKLNRLGTKEWSRTKTRVRGALQVVAKDLVELYAKRMEGTGFVYSEDDVWQTEFEEMFPYEETQDQKDAIRDTKQDMESTKIMDRLICGDVGYGKTEIAIRAAFKAAMNSKQVVYLCPTTILAQQHYNTFVQRMQDFPVRVDLMCRFRTPTEQKKTLADLKDGVVDIVIGTHRLLSEDVKFRDLGLLIVDEEQRFGVKHKEKIKKMKDNIDVLTLTATPIPRTLHMSMIGVRDMSVLEEGPEDRVPIQTYCMEQNMEMVREAINRELARNGQVYYVYNRVASIAEKAAEIAELCPDAVVAYAHGQMEERKLEGIMLDFINGDIDVLVTTTIIETGLDISNVNTIIIHDSDRFGLSQLYQLRGRVGRSNRTAYAFIMYNPGKILTEVAEKRLQAIRECTELGSGVKIAMKDLEIRGAGSILGEHQHGHIEAVGYDLYCKMLHEEVSKIKAENSLGDSAEAGTAVMPDFDTTIELKVSAYIPEDYITNEGQKLDFYKRIASLETEEELFDLRDELIDRFGDFPQSVENLLQISAIRSFAHQAYITYISGSGSKMTIKMYPQANVNIDRLMALLKDRKNTLSFQAQESSPTFTFKPVSGGSEGVARALSNLKKLINDIKMLLD